MPPPQSPVGADQPKINAGSPTHPVDVVAALSADGKLLTVAILNANEAAQQIDLIIKGIALQAKGRTPSKNYAEAKSIAEVESALRDFGVRLHE